MPTNELLLEQTACYIGENLFSVFATLTGKVGIKTGNKVKIFSTVGKYTEWLHSNDGIEAIENSMIDKGYMISESFDGLYWLVTFSKKSTAWKGYRAPTKIEAVIGSALNILKYDEQNAKTNT